MKKIIKSKEPKELTAYRSSVSKEDMENKNIYEDYSDGGVLREQLLKEQGYVCCYCMSRISLRNSKIEHFKPQSIYRDLQINYSNLFVACKGGEGTKNRYCDTAKANKELKSIDLLLSIEEDIKYSKKGKISSIVSTEKKKSDLTNEIDTILHLNSHILVANRKKVYDDFRQNQRRWSKTDLLKAIEYYQNRHNGKYAPYSEMMVYLLTQKLKGK